MQAFEPVQLGPLTLRNRIIKAATFEGVMPRGAVTPELVEFHRRTAAGGVALTTVAYCAVSKGGRVSRDTMVFRPELAKDLRAVTDAVHGEGALIGAQLGHAGLVAQGHSHRNPSLAPTTRFSPAAMGRVKGATAADLDTVQADFVTAATTAIEAGFDGIELHLGHNYLLSSFLSPNLNRRHDAYGGDAMARLEFPRRVISAVRETVDRLGGSKVALWAKFNMDDGVPGGLWLTDSIPMAMRLEADGCLDALELTGGSSLANGMYFFRGDVPLREFAEAQPALVGLGVRMFGRRIFPTYPYEEAFFLPLARQFRAALTMPLILLGGISERATVDRAVDEGFEFVAMARALLREPDLIGRWSQGADDDSLCIHCNKCMPTIYSGTRCVLVSPSGPSPSAAPA